MSRFATLSVATALLVGLAGCAGDAARDVTQYSVAQFYENNEYFGASFSHDNTRVLVSTNRSGVFNAWAFPVGGGEPEQLTMSTTDAIFASSFFPADDRLLYSSDQGGNELSHVYVRAADGTVTDLTPGENLNASFAGWADDDASFFVQSNERNPQLFDVYEYATDGYARTMLYQNDEGFMPGPSHPTSATSPWCGRTRPRTPTSSSTTGRPARRSTSPSTKATSPTRPPTSRRTARPSCSRPTRTASTRHSSATISRRAR